MQLFKVFRGCDLGLKFLMEGRPLSRLDEMEFAIITVGQLKNKFEIHPINQLSLHD